MGLDMELMVQWTEADELGVAWTYTDYGMEWRKANAVHGWFVRNVCGGACENDTCYDVSREQIEELARTCRRVLEDTSLAESLMPAVDGYWFGSTEYGSAYTQDLVWTASGLERLLDETPPHVTFVYRASW